MIWIQLIIALLAYLGSKKAGASNTTAALTAVGAGLATHYVTTQTEWGRENLQPINNSISRFFGISSGNVSDGVATDVDGNVVTGPEDHVPVKQPDGSIVWLPSDLANNGSSFWGATSDTLKSWGGIGTAAVIGTASAASGNNNMFWLLIGAGALILLR